MDYKITTYSEEETIELAQNIESEKFPNMVICLEGDLGTGKTVFTKGFAKAMEIDEVVTSPTFNIIKEYTSGELPLYHMDVYRLDGKVGDLGIEEYFTKKGVTIIMITHDMHLMLEYTDRAIVLSKGKKIKEDTTADILTDEHVIIEANLRETSLYTLALKCGINDPKEFVRKFIDISMTKDY